MQPHHVDRHSYRLSSSSPVSCLVVAFPRFRMCRCWRPGDLWRIADRWLILTTKREEAVSKGKMTLRYQLLSNPLVESDRTPTIREGKFQFAAILHLQRQAIFSEKANGLDDAPIFLQSGHNGLWIGHCSNRNLILIHMHFVANCDLFTVVCRDSAIAFHRVNKPLFQNVTYFRRWLWLRNAFLDLNGFHAF